tara:strand:+ start:7486 stop:7683 length:198 start_codon:yes stop_codon:yes gene_type:complete
MSRFKNQNKIIKEKERKESEEVFNSLSDIIAKRNFDMKMQDLGDLEKRIVLDDMRKFLNAIEWND